MGNRAVITCDRSLNGVGVYLHWNGGPRSVEAFLTYCKLKNYRSPEEDPYGWARLCQVVGNFFGGNNSVGIDICKNLDCDNYDNGTYIIKDWKIVGRMFSHCGSDNYDIKEFMLAIDAKMPKEERIAPFIKAVEMGPNDKWRVGDVAYHIGFCGQLSSGTVVGFTEWDGAKVPYTDEYQGGAENPNNLIVPDRNGKVNRRRKLRPKRANS